MPALPVLHDIASQLGVGPPDLLAFDLNEARYALLDLSGNTAANASRSAHALAARSRV